MTNYYSVEHTLQNEANAGKGRTIACETLRAMGLTTDPTGPVTRVTVTPSDWGSAWGVDVPAGRADEYARQLWKDPMTTKVEVSFTNFPKPTERTVADVEKEFAAFKKKVAKVAVRTRQEEDWCFSGFSAAMKELGLEIPKQNAQIVLEVEVPYNVDPDDLESVQNWVKNVAGRDYLGESVTSTEEV